MSEIAPGQTLDRFDVLDVIARSGMATIFHARDRNDGKDVVLKVPHIQYEADIVFHERFRREEEIGLRLGHPGVIRLFPVEPKSRVYLAMEYVEGELLRDRLRREGRLAVPAAVDLAIRIADILVYLHANKVVHRDLKPENVMILPDGNVKLMDFGIALDATQGKLTWGGLSQTVGTPDYMAPEQVRGHRGDERTDVYSLGIMLYEMLTGQVPFSSDNAYAAMRSKTDSDPAPPRFYRPEVPAELEEVILQAIANDPRDRPESALELREMLAHPQSVIPRSRDGRGAGRLPRWARVVATLAASAAGFLALWTSLYAVTRLLSR